MGDGGGRLAGFVGALMEGRIRIGSPPRVRGRRRKIRDAAVRRGVVPLLHGTRPHRPDAHAPSPLVVAVRRILGKKRGKNHFDEISKTHAPAFFIPLQPFERNGLSIFILPDRTRSHFILLFFPFRESNKKNDDRRKWESRFLPVGSLEGSRFSRMDDGTDNGRELFAFFLEVLVSLPT